MSKRDNFLYEHVVHRGRGERPVIERGEGIYLYDRDGNRYLDGASGAAVVNLGHGVEEVVEAMREQARLVSYAAPSVFAHQSTLTLGEVISARAPGTLKGECRVWFNCTGTDAVDDALRLARQYFVASGNTSKHLIISRWQSFHGNSIGMAGVHGHTKRRRLFSAMFVNSAHIPAAFCYRCPFRLSFPDCDLRCAWALETEIRQQGPENVAAFVAEPVVGAALAGVPAPEGYFEIIRQICDTYDVLFIADEVMSGWGRCGDWFAIESWGVTPDIIALGKGLGAGYTPIAATIAGNKLWQAIEDYDGAFMAGHTMNQNPTSCAAALAVVRYMESHDLLANIQKLGEILRAQLDTLLDFEIVGDVRGMGLLCGMEFVRNKATKEPFDPSLKVSTLFQKEALKRGLVIYPCTGSVDGIAGDMILVAPPYMISEGQLHEMVKLISDAVVATIGAVN